MKLNGKMRATMLAAVIGLTALAACAPIPPEASPSADVPGEISGLLTVAAGETVPAGADVVIDVLDLADWTPGETNVMSGTDGSFPGVVVTPL